MLQVLGAGFGRTGTLSLTRALDILGYGPCYHMFEVMGRSERVRAWRRAADGEPVDWDRMFAGYRAAADWPAAYFWRRLAAEFPEAKVVLTVRDPEDWYASMWRMVDAASQEVGQVARAAGERMHDTSRGIARDMYELNELVEAVIWQGTFDGRFADKRHAIGVFEAHNAAVRAEIPSERLLEFDVTDGWAPLCGFLGADVPAGEPFPRTNDEKSYGAAVRDTFRTATGE